MSETPADLRYSNDHLWVRPDTTTSVARVGITDYGQDSLGDTVNVTLPTLGQTVTNGQACGEIESTKSINDLISPLDGTVRTRNETLTDTPEVVNADPYGRGWLFDVEVAMSTLDAQLAKLLDASEYSSLVAG
jgi:glycine cleavage system H protein